MKSVLSNVGTAFVALATSACCWIPALLGASAAGSLGVSAALAPWRPHLLVLTGLFLAGGFYMAYRRPQDSCSPGSSCATSGSTSKRMVNIVVMWAVAAFAIGSAAYPPVATRLSDAGRIPPAQITASAKSVVLDLKGMDCEACAATIKTTLEQVAGVRAARVDYDEATATVWLEEPQPEVSELIDAVLEAGFEAERVSENERSSEGNNNEDS